MARLNNKLESQVRAAEITRSLAGRRCWYGYTSVGNTFQIALGRKVPRDREDFALRQKLAARRAARGVPVKGDPLVREFDRYTGEANLLVWCSWRLDGERGPVTSWDDEPARAEVGIRGLMGRTIRSVTIGPGWDLRLEFGGGMALNVFPDHVGPSASFDGNWEVWKPEKAYLIGTNLACKVLDREHNPLRLGPRAPQRDSRPRVNLRKLRTIKQASA